MTPFKRTLVVGKAECWNRAGNKYNGSLWITVEYTQKDGKDRLSITGVHAPKANGDCDGSCGQCVDTLLEVINGPADNRSLPLEDLARLHQIWDDWHLNDMRAYCDHQKRIHRWDPKEMVTIWKWKLTPEVIQLQSQLRQASEKRLMAGEQAQYNSDELDLLKKPYWAYSETEQPPSADYTADGKESKAVGWLYPIDQLGSDAFHTGESCHSKGLLTKPCPTCGHKYGSGWLHQSIPADVLEFLHALPDQSGLCPWKR